MHSTHSLLAQSSAVRRRLALICAALVSALALFTAIAAVEASAATPHTAKLFDKSWTVKFRNSYGKHVDVAIMRWSPGNCQGRGDWEIKGWYGVEPGEVKSLFTTTNRYAGYYAEADDGHIWDGDRGPAYVPDDAFATCLAFLRGTGAKSVGMRMITLPDMSFPTTHVDQTINLIP